MYRFMYFIRCGKFQSVLSSDILSVSFSLSSPFGVPITPVLVWLMVSHRSLKVCLFFFILFSFYTSSWIITVDLSSSLQTLSSASLMLLLSPLRVFHFSYCTFQLQNFYLVPFCNLYIFISFFKKIYLFIWLWEVLVAAGTIFSCGVWHPVP